MIPKYLYHGTSSKNYDKIFSEGLSPRGETGLESLWEYNPSHEDAVYLTTAYAHYYASCACSNNEDLLILKIDTDFLDYYSFFADEDAVEQATRGNDSLDYLKMDLSERTEFYKNRIRNYDAETSLEVLGNCTYHDIIPTKAIVDYRVISPMNNAKLVIQYGYDPTITIQNFKFLQSKYEALMESMFSKPEDQDIFLPIVHKEFFKVK